MTVCVLLPTQTFSRLGCVRGSCSYFTVGKIKQELSFFISIFPTLSPTHTHTVPIPCIPSVLSEAGFQERGTLIELSFYGLPGVSVYMRRSE